MEINPLTEDHRRTREEIDHQDPVDLTDPRLKRITRLRLVSDIGFPYWDVSYCYGELEDGTPVRVNLPEFQFSRGRSRPTLKMHMVRMCQEHGLYAKGLGLLDPDVISTLI